MIATQEAFVGSKAQRGSLPEVAVTAVTKRTNQFPKAVEVAAAVLSLADRDPCLADPYRAGLVLGQTEKRFAVLEVILHWQTDLLRATKAKRSC